MKQVNLFILSGILFSLSPIADAVEDQQDVAEYVSPFSKENENCFVCHSVKKYSYTDEGEGKTFKGVMNTEGILSRDEFYSSTHKSFSCTDCHSSQFRSFPHSEDAIAAKHFNCLDCHGGDPAFAVFNFETLDSEFRRSVHFRLEEKGFTCWQCHDPHEYRLRARHSDDPKTAIKYDNDICLGCHDNFGKFSRFSEKKIKIKKVHKWLPHQDTHFASVRCLECHGKENEKILVAHYVMPEKAALRDCRECHADDNKAMASLLITRSYNNTEGTNSAFTEGLSLIGPSRNKALDKMLVTVFMIIMAGMSFHFLMRIILRKT